MAPGPSTDIKELVRSRTDLVELVSETVALTPLSGGRDFIGLCPFHDDHKPSFHVYPERQSYRCWACGAGGDCFSFVMERERLEFRPALELLARRANIELPSFQGRSSGSGRDERQRLLEALAWADGEFHRCLLTAPEAARARQYLREKRGFTDETVRQFRLGYSPDSWDWLLSRARGKFTPQQLLAVGLVRERGGANGERTGGHYDYFRDRAMFPIRDVQGRPVAFGGRILPDSPHQDTGKYFNSPESDFYKKSTVLYGFDVAREAIRKSDTAVIVEGYTDCIMAHQHGVKNIVAPCGTALTDTHVAQLKRFARKVVLVFDGDKAGQDASERVLVKLLSHEIDLRLLTLPGGADPADFLSEHGGPAFQERIAAAPEAWEYKLRTAIDRYGVESIDARQRVLDEMLELVSHVARLNGTPREQLLFSRLAQRLALDEPAVRRRLAEVRRRNSVKSGAAAPALNAGPPRPADPYQAEVGSKLECEVLEVVFAAPELVDQIRQHVGVDHFRNAACRALLEVCYVLAEGGSSPSFERVMSEIEDVDLKRVAVTIDEQSQRKRIAEKLRHDPRQGAAPPQPKLLTAALDRLKWHREREAHEASRGQLAQLTTTPGKLDGEAKQLLRQTAKFNQKRAT
ncbi:MAG TPA: DNA primase [Planctomycetaceae bacterium]|nr:DNA primase [Planctomycetaceae bacterium]